MVKPPLLLSYPIVGELTDSSRAGAPAPTSALALRSFLAATLAFSAVTSRPGKS